MRSEIWGWQRKRVSFCKTAIMVGVGCVLWMQVGCAGFGQKLKAFLGGGQTNSSQPRSQNLVKYSENSAFLGGPRRTYRRVTKKSLADESDINDKSGSLWTVEGQGAYLFAQNIMRMLGDPLTVKIEGEAKEQLQGKVDVIRGFMNRLEERQKAKMRALASNSGESGDGKSKDKKDKDGKSSGDKEDKQSSSKDNSSQEKTETAQDLSVKSVPTRIVERMSDGNYRVKGFQPFMVGQREYKVIVTGIVRAEDFVEEGLPASKLLDPKFDIVSARKREEE